MRRTKLREAGTAVSVLAAILSVHSQCLGGGSFHRPGECHLLVHDNGGGLGSHDRGDVARCKRLVV